MKKTISLFTIIIAHSAVCLSNGLFNNQPRFEKMSIEDGLSQSDITAIIQDNIGFMWFATNNGLNRYNGYDFTTYKQSNYNNNTISSNIINCLYIDKGDNLWVGTKNGVDRFDILSDRFENHLRMCMHDSRDTLDIIQVQALAEDGDSQLWMAAAEFICRYDDINQCFTAYPFGRLAADESIGAVNDIAINRKGNLLVATDRGVYVMDRKNMVTRRLFYPPHIFGQNSSGVRKIYVDHDENCIYVCAEQGVFIIDQDGNFLYEIMYGGKSIGKATCMTKDASKNKWIGTSDKGVYCVYQNMVYNYANDKKIEASLSKNDVLSIYHDRSRVLWIGTSTGGVNKLRLSEKPFRNMRHTPFDGNSLNPDTIRGLYMDDEGILWAGVRANGIDRIDVGKNAIRHYFVRDNPAVVMSCIVPRSSRQLWVGTNSGLYSFDKASGVFTPHNPVEAVNRYIVNMLVDSQGRLWCGTNAGVAILNADGSVYRGERLLPSEQVRVIFEDSEHNIWIGTRNNGAYRYSADLSAPPVSYTVAHNGTPSISNNDISTFFEDSRGRLWIGTWGGGLNLLDEAASRFVCHTEEDGLSDNVIFSINEDLSGALWLATYNGLTYFDPQTGEFRVYTSHDGLLSNEFAVKAAAQSPDGTIYLGSIYGLTYFDPEAIKSYTSDPAGVAVTSLRIFNDEIKPGVRYGKRTILQKSIFATDKIKLSYLDRSISFDFASFSYAAPERNRFAYKMEGLDKDWNNADHKHSASYSNLKPGKYRFLLKGSNSDGVWNETPYRLDIEITPPFLQTTAAYVFYVAAFASLLFWLFSLFRKRIVSRSENMLRRVRSESETRIYDEKMKFYINISHDLRTPLTLIIGLIARVEATLDGDARVSGQLSVMKRNANLLLRLVTELIDLRKIETGNMKVDKTRRDMVSFAKNIFYVFEESAKASGISFVFRSESETLEVAADYSKTEKIIYNLLSNAMKFTHNYIEVGVRTETRDGAYYAVVCVRDNGKGVSKKETEKIFRRFYQSEDNKLGEGSGVGLNLALEMARIQGGELTVSSVRGEGATFYLRLPMEVREDLQDDGAANDSAKDTGLLPLALVIDDNDDMRYYIRQVMSSDFRIREAAGGGEGFELARKLIPELIISDVMMPDMSGIELCEKLKTDNATRNIPVVLITARNSEEDRVSGLEKGADAYLIKPFAEEHLKALAASVIKKHNTIRKQLRVELISAPKELAVTSVEERVLLKVMKLLEEHIADEGYTIESLCADLDISPMQLHRQMKRATGESPGKFIQNFRLSRAADLLRQNKMNVSEAAFTTGFSDPKYFRICFKKKYGMTPLQYIKENSGRES